MSEIRCSIELSTNLSQCLDRDAGRFPMHSALVVPAVNAEAESKDSAVYAVATNSKCLAIVRAPGKTDSPALLPHDVAKAGTPELNGRWELATGRKGQTIKTADERKAGDNGCFPPVHDVVPTVIPLDSIILRIDARLLASLAEALTIKDSFDHGLTLFIPKPKDKADGLVEGAIVVQGTHGIGAIMPLAIKDHGDSSTVRGEYHATAADSLSAVKAGVKSWNDSVIAERARIEQQRS